MNTKSTVIPGFPSYHIFKDGRVQNIKSVKFLKSSIHNGYYRVGLYNNKKTYKYYIHKLLAICFIENPLNKITVDHINRNKLDNNLNNLRWATYSEQNFNQGLRKDNILKEKFIRKSKYNTFELRFQATNFSESFETLENAKKRRFELFGF
jgi:hypothetical protein